MKIKLKKCPACGKDVAKGASKCPHCGKAFTTAAGLVLMIFLGTVVGGVLTLKTCSDAKSANDEMDEIRARLLPNVK